MEVLDTSIAMWPCPILRQFRGSNDESTWVLTSYLVSNAIVLPISGWLVTWLGRKRFFLTCIAFFTISSFLCGVAPNLGFFSCFAYCKAHSEAACSRWQQAILGDTFPPEKRGLAFALYGVTAICARLLLVQRWEDGITDNYSWRWIFYINVPVGALALALVYRLVEESTVLGRSGKAALRLRTSSDFLS